MEASIQKVINLMAVKMPTQNHAVPLNLEAINVIWPAQPLISLNEKNTDRTRESHLAVWTGHFVASTAQAAAQRASSLSNAMRYRPATPLYEIVQGIFTPSLDIALLNEKIDIASIDERLPTQTPKALCLQPRFEKGVV